MTLICEDGQQVEAHKVILAASSPLLQKLLCVKSHPHPLIYMRGVKFDDLVAIVDFLYYGEANVFQENLDSFLAVAEELQLKGMMGRTNERVEDLDNRERPQPTFDAVTNLPRTDFKRKTSDNNKVVRAEDNKVAIQCSYSGDLDKLAEMVKSMMEKSESKHASGHQKADRCKVCGKEGMGSAIKDHIEANHIEGIALPCNLCEKVFRSGNGLKLHNRCHHKNNQTCYKLLKVYPTFFQQSMRFEKTQSKSTSSLLDCNTAPICSIFIISDLV